MFYYITRYTGKSKDAGTKAPKDINSICQQMGGKEIPFYKPIKTNDFMNSIRKLLINEKNWIRLQKVARKGDVVLYQHPMYFGTKSANRYIPKLQKKGIRFVALIHDLESLRNLTSKTKEAQNAYVYGDLVLLKHFDAIIAHNVKMKDFLLKQGFDGSKIICLEIFDYLRGQSLKIQESNEPKEGIAVAGNLDPEKCGYIYEFAEQNPSIKVKLYGGNFCNQKELKNIFYQGSFSPEEILEQLNCQYGLVWDGPSAKTCEGNTGEYLKYNNPHKTSLYLSAGVPVIVWKDAAISDFVLKNHVGIAVETLENLHEELGGVSEEEYEIMCVNAKKIGNALKDGFYFKQAFQSACSICG